eukprot:scaffold34758_cov214-Amphora_coffeaeformis.AAC.3
MDYSMEGPKWDSISKEAKSFIRGLLQFDPALRYTPFEALHSPWLKQQTEFNVENMSKSERVILEKAKEAHAPMKELQKLSLYAIAHKARSEDVASLRKLYLAIEGEDGEISLPDMQRALKGQLTPEQIKEWFKRSDFEYSGKINFTQFVAGSYDAQKKLSSQEIIDAFRFFDRDDSGFITADNLREALKIEKGEYIDELIHEADFDGDGVDTQTSGGRVGGTRDASKVYSLVQNSTVVSKQRLRKSIHS